MTIDHIAIWTSDLEKEKEFFLRYFDCTLNDRYINHKTGFSSYFISFRSGARIELMTKPGISLQRDEGTGGLAHFAVELDSREEVDKLTEHFQSEGIHVAGKPRITGDGYYESVILDPEGNMIELVSI